MSHCNKKMISFFLTTKCNLCCSYCYNAHERAKLSEQTLPLEIAYAGIDWYFEHNESRHIRFYGPGEPTQEFEKMMAITQYAKTHPNGGERVTVEIQTNGIFTEEVRQWVAENVNIIWMSFDGMPEIQDKYRPLNPKYNSLFGNRKNSQILEDNVRWLISNSDNNQLMVGARATIIEDNISKQLEMVDYFHSLGIKYVWTDPLFYSVDRCPVAFDESKKGTMTLDLDQYVDNHIEASRYASSKGMFWRSFFEVNFDGCSEYHCRCCTPLSAPHLTPDGYISACDMVVLGKEAYHMSPFVVGKWNTEDKSFELYCDKITTLNNRKSTTMKHCKECDVQMYCGGYCLGETLNETGSLTGEIPDKCKAIKKLFTILGSCEPYAYLHP